MELKHVGDIAILWDDFYTALDEVIDRTSALVTHLRAKRGLASFDNPLPVCDHR